MDPTAPPITTLPDADKFCAVCKKTDVSLGGCANCRSICYCSKACQKADWNLHRMLCDAFANEPNPRPTDEDGKPYKRCIFFDARKRAPEVFWVRARGNQSRVMDRLFTRDDYQKYLRGEFDPMAMMLLNKIKTHNKKGKGFLALFSNKVAPFGNLAVTAAARRLEEAMWGSYHGSVFLIRQMYEGDKSHFEDVTPAEFRAAVQQLSQKLVPNLIALQRDMGQQAFDELVAQQEEEDFKK